MATQLSELYVQVSAKGMAEAQSEIRKLRNELAATKKPAEDMQNGLSGIGSMALSQMGPLGMLIGGFKNLYSLFANPPKPKIPVLPRADGIPVAKPAGGGALGGMSAGAMAGIGAAVAVVGMAVSHTLGMIDALKNKMMGLARQGFEGTTEMYRYEFAMKLISREIAGALVPALNALTSFLMGVQRAIASVGPIGQKVFAAMLVGVIALTGAVTVLTGVVAVLIVGGAPIAVVFFAVAGALAAVAGAIYLAWTNSKEFRGAVMGLKDQFMSLLVTLEPVGMLLLKIGGFMLKAFVIEPLIAFVTVLTVALKLLERMVKLSGLLKLIPKDAAGAAGTKTNVTMNQTGTESGDQTFQRIQQEILKMGLKEEPEDVKQTNFLKSIDEKLEKFFGKTDAPNAPPAAAIIGGSAGSGALGGYLDGLGLGSAFGRR